MADIEAKAKRQSKPRRPARGRGFARYQELVKATEILLQAEDPLQVGLYQIAEQAEIPPASVYHFFPTKEAAFTAVAIKALGELMDVHREPIPARDVLTWQALYRVDVDRAQKYFNSNPAGMKILYGGYGSVDSRNIDESSSKRMAGASYRRMDSIYHMPFIRDPDQKFANRMAILDAIWSNSVRKFGFITDEYQDEAYIACVAYAKTYLPERIEPRPELIKAAEAGLTVSLGHDSFMLDAPIDENDQPSTSEVET